jgi:hypothetical protein
MVNPKYFSLCLGVFVVQFIILGVLIFPIKRETVLTVKSLDFMQFFTYVFINIVGRGLNFAHTAH